MGVQKSCNLSCCCRNASVAATTEEDLAPGKAQSAHQGIYFSNSKAKRQTRNMKIMLNCALHAAVPLLLLCTGSCVPLLKTCTQNSDART